MNEQVVGIVHTPSVESSEGYGASIAERLAKAGLETRRLDRPSDGQEMALVVAIGREAVAATMTGGPGSPILPILSDLDAKSDGYPEPESVVEVIRGADGRTVEAPIVAVSMNGSPVGRAGIDVAAMSAEPARIAGYTVHDGASAIASFRADGVVIATPVGSPTYNRRAGGSHLDPAVGHAVSVVPVAPFQIQRRTWVLHPDGVAVSLDRATGPVDVQLDGTQRAQATTGDRIACTVADTVHLIRPPTARGIWG